MDKSTLMRVFTNATPLPCKKTYVNSCLEFIEESVHYHEMFIAKWCSGIKFMFKDIVTNIEFIKDQCEAIGMVLEIKDVFDILYMCLFTDDDNIRKESADNED